MTEEFSIPACADAGMPSDAAVQHDAGAQRDAGDAAVTTGAGAPCGDASTKLCAANLSTGPLAISLKWSKPSFGGTHDEVHTQPIVTRLGDSSPHIVVIGSGEDNDVYLYAVSGDGNMVTLNHRVAGLAFASGLAAADLDHDGHVELVAADDNFGLIALSDTGALKWTRDDLGADLEGFDTPAIADMDGDGVPEISCGRVVLNADGTIRLALPPDAAASRRASVPADVDGDGKLELVLGVGAYRLDGTALWSDATSKGGFIALANFDADATPELVVVGNGAIRLLDAENGHEHWSTPFVVESGNDFTGGPPVIADFDGDGLPEIGAQGTTEYTVIDGDGSVLWTHPIMDNSAFTGSIAFDFDGDGSAEVVQTDTQNVRILSGIDGSVRFEGPRQSVTGKESATVADIDGDGHAELIVPFDDPSASRRGIDV
jgi:outer membrane protein assembly factor BamB